MIMASNRVDDNSVKQDIIEKQVTISELMHYMTAFDCAYCVPYKVQERSPEYLIALGQMKCHLYNLMGIMRDLFADWPIQCDCMIQLQMPIAETFRMVEYLFEWYPNAYNVNAREEADMIRLFDAIYKDAYKFHTLFIHVLAGCLESHTFLETYNYSNITKCIVCRYKERGPTCDSSSSEWSRDDDVVETNNHE